MLRILDIKNFRRDILQKSETVPLKSGQMDINIWTRLFGLLFHFFKIFLFKKLRFNVFENLNFGFRNLLRSENCNVKKLIRKLLELFLFHSGFHCLSAVFKNFWIKSVAAHSLRVTDLRLTLQAGLQLNEHESTGSISIELLMECQH
jgi:hypothetical protein